jgi:hypothetical protein
MPSFTSLECSVRQEGALSQYHFAIYIDDFVQDIKKPDFGGEFSHLNVVIFMHAHDIILPI